MVTGTAGHPRDLDAEDWWYRTTFDAPDLPPGHPCHLCFDGLATLAEVWLNGHRLLTTDNMFRAYRVNVALYLRPRNELVLGFRSLAEELKKKRSRPSLEDQPGESPAASLVSLQPAGTDAGLVAAGAGGRPLARVYLDTQPFSVSERRLTSHGRGRGRRGRLHVRVHAAAPVVRASAAGRRPRSRGRLFEEDGDGWLLRAALRLPHPPLWWPHTHGEQPLVECALHLDVGTGHYTVPCGQVGFRQLQASQDDGFSIQVNGVPVYCRGVCWTVSDILTPGRARGGARARSAPGPGRGREHAAGRRHHGVRERRLLSTLR